jgi:hypothetical protein
MSNFSFKVAAVNEVHQVLNQAAANAMPALKTFIGKKVRLSNDKLSTKIINALPPLPPCYTIYYSANPYSLTIKACVRTSGTNISVYAEGVIEIGQVSNGHLTKAREPKKLRTDWTVKAVQAAQETVRKARQDLDEAEKNLVPFDMFTH